MKISAPHITRASYAGHVSTTKGWRCSKKLRYLSDIMGKINASTLRTSFTSSFHGRWMIISLSAWPPSDQSSFQMPICEQNSYVCKWKWLAWRTQALLINQIELRSNLYRAIITIADGEAVSLFIRFYHLRVQVPTDELLEMGHWLTMVTLLMRAWFKPSRLIINPLLSITVSFVFN